MKKRIATLVLTALCVAGFSAAAVAANYVSIATGGTSGTYYPLGGAIAQAVSKGSNIQATAESSNASVANINLVAKGEIEVAFVQNDITFWAYNGQQMFKEPLKNVRSIGSLYPEHIQFIVTKDSGVKSLMELKGKRVGVGAPGSGTEGDCKALFEAAGMTYNDMKVDFLDFGATTSRFKDNQIDAGIVVSGYPTASIMDLVTAKPVTLLNFDDEFLSKLSKAHPYFISSKIPGGTYTGMDEDVTTPAVMAILVTNDSISEDVIYQFTKAMWENIDVVHAAHAKGKEINLATALDGLTAPLHPGAAKYYKEKGMTLP